MKQSYKLLFILMLSSLVLFGTICSSSFAGWKSFEEKDFSVKIEFVHDNMPSLDYKDLNWLLTESWWWTNPLEAKDVKSEGFTNGTYVRFKLDSEKSIKNATATYNGSFSNTYRLNKDLYGTWRANFESRQYYRYDNISDIFSNSNVNFDVQFENGNSQSATIEFPDLPESYNYDLNIDNISVSSTEPYSIEFTASNEYRSDIEIYTFDDSSYSIKYNNYENADETLYEFNNSDFPRSKKYFYLVSANQNTQIEGVDFQIIRQGKFVDNTNIDNGQISGNYEAFQLENANGNIYTSAFRMTNYSNGNSTWITPNDNSTAQFTAYENGRLAWSPYHRGAFAQDSNVIHFSEYIPNGDQGLFVGIKEGSNLNNSTLDGKYIVCESDTSNSYPKTSIIQVDFNGNGEFSGTIIEDPDNIHTTNEELSGTYSVSSNGDFVLEPKSIDYHLEGKVSPDGDVFTHGGEEYCAIGLRKESITETTLRGEYLISEVGLHSVDALWASDIRAKADGYGYIEGTVLGTTNPDLTVGASLSSNYYIGSDYGLLNFSVDDSKGIALADGSMFVLCSTTEDTLRIGTRSPSRKSQVTEAELNFEKHKLRQSDKLYYEYSQDVSETLNKEWNEGNIDWILNKAIDAGIPSYYYIESEIEVSDSINTKLESLQVHDNAGNTYDCLLDEREEKDEENITSYQYVISPSGNVPYTTSSYVELADKFNGLITLDLKFSDGSTVTKYINAVQFDFPNLPVVDSFSLGETSKFNFHDSGADTYSVKIIHRNSNEWDAPLNSTEEIENPEQVTLSTDEFGLLDESMYIAELQNAYHYGNYHFHTQSVRYVYNISESNKVPNEPILENPLNGTENVSTTPELQTGNFSDPDGDSHSLTKWKISNATGNTVLNLETNSALISLEVPDFALQHNATYKWQACFVDSMNKESCSDLYEFTTKPNTEDVDGDGVPDDQDPGDNATVNGDKVVKCASDSGKQVGANSTDDSIIETMKSVDPDNPKYNTENKPTDFPFDLIATRIQVAEEGDDATVTINYSEPVSDPAYYKYDPARGWYEFEDAEFNQNKQSVTLRLVDGGAGDADGKENGVIVDPGGVTQDTTTTSDDTTSSGGGGGGCVYSPAASGGWSWMLLLLIPAFSFAVRRYNRMNA